MALAHVIMIMMGSVQAEQAFYTIPHKNGYYDTADSKVIEAEVLIGRMKSTVTDKPGGILSNLKDFTKNPSNQDLSYFENDDDYK